MLGVAQILCHMTSRMQQFSHTEAMSQIVSGTETFFLKDSEQRWGNVYNPISFLAEASYRS